jgi:hypothetical protein
MFKENQREWERPNPPKNHQFIPLIGEGPIEKSSSTSIIISEEII